MNFSEKNILAVGSIALDSLETINGNRDEVLGGSATYFGIAASFFAPVSVVGIVGNDFPQSGWDLFSKFQIDTSNVDVEPGTTFRWGGTYSDDYSTRSTRFTELGVFEKFSPKIDDNYHSSHFVFLGNIQPELQLQVAAQIKNAKYVVCDTMNLWIDLSKDRLWDVIKTVDMFLLNDEEALQLTGLSNIETAADELLAHGPSVVIIKQGGNGALLAYKTEKIHVPVFPIDKLVDPTGAGDSFAGGFIGHLVNSGESDLLEAVITGSAVASFTVSDFGVNGLVDASVSEIEHRKAVIRNSVKKFEV